MSPRLKTKSAPDGWRWLQEGEMVIYGDYFNVRSAYPDEEPSWYPCKSLVGNAYGGSGMRIIRREDTNAPLPANAKTDEDKREAFKKFRKDYRPVKTRVADYIKKSQKKIPKKA